MWQLRQTSERNGSIVASVRSRGRVVGQRLGSGTPGTGCFLLALDQIVGDATADQEPAGSAADKGGDGLFGIKEAATLARMLRPE